VPVVHRPARVALVRARFDAAQTTDENRNHWAAADALSPDAAASPGVRQALRNRCRYEYANNSYCKGVVDTLATDAVGGTGPRLQMLTGSEELNDAIETDFADWAEEIGLAEVLRTMRAGRAHSGEVFGLMATNPGLDQRRQARPVHRRAGPGHRPVPVDARPDRHRWHRVRHLRQPGSTTCCGSIPAAC
jgi:capsid protein